MNYTKIFLEEANKYPEFLEAQEIAKENSRGNIWLIGGFIYRNLAANLYGTKKPEIDLDFIVEDINKEIIIPSKWKLQKSRMGCSKLVGPKYDIDLVHFENIFSFEMFNLAKNIGNFLSTTPLNIQSIVYDFNRQKLVGEKGIEAIEKKLIIPTENKKIRNYVSEKKEMPFDDYVKKYAKELDFGYIL